MKRNVGILEYWNTGRRMISSRSHHSIIPSFHHSNSRRGFTLLEIMISIVILAIAMAIAFQTFSAVTRGWTSARIIMDRVHHGDFVLGQLSSALRSMAFFTNSQEQCGFRIENNSTGKGEHTISWVTASSAFIPPGEDAYSHGLHRIEVGGGTDEDGVDGLVVTVWPYLADEKKVEKKHWFVSENIKGLSCKVYDTNEEKNSWEDTWEYSNKIPGLVEITLYAEPVKEYDKPVEFRQIIEIPLGPPVTNEVSEAK